MDAVEFLGKLRKYLRESYQAVGDALIAGGVDSMDKYKYMLGRAQAFKDIDQEISNLLTTKEQKKDEQKDNVVTLKGQSLKGDTKD